MMRITQENSAILRRIQHAQPVYNHVAWEHDYMKREAWLRNAAEFPVVLNRGLPRSGSMTPVRQEHTEENAPDSVQDDAAQTDGQGNGVSVVDLEDLQYVFKGGRRIGDHFYLVEMATDGITLTVSAYQGE